MRVIYIAGPYSGKTYLEIDRNIAAAREAAAQLAEAEIGYLSPHLMSCHFEVIAPSAPYKYWTELYLCILKFCDGILLLPGWEKSPGSCKEKELVDELGMPVFYNVQEVIAYHEV